MNFDVSASLKLRRAAAECAPAVLGIVKMRLSQVSGVPAIVDNLARSIQDMVIGKNVQGLVMGKAAREYYERLLQNDRPMEQLEASVQSTMTASVSNQGQAAAQVINFFLADENKEHKDELVRLSKLDTPEADTQILSLVSEAMRLDPQVPLIPRVAKVDATIPDGDRKIPVKKGDFVFPSMLKAGMVRLACVHALGNALTRLANGRTRPSSQSLRRSRLATPPSTVSSATACTPASARPSSTSRWCR